jgi:hypothetical protein
LERHGGLTQMQLRCSLRDAAEAGDRYEMHAVAAATRFASRSPCDRYVESAGLISQNPISVQRDIDIDCYDMQSAAKGRDA